MNSTKKIFLTLGVIVMLPALFYSVYEISSLDETEEMIGQMYGRQLDAILFSVNQHILDVASSWATQIENELPKNAFDRIITANPSITSIIVTDTSCTTTHVFPVDRREYTEQLQKHFEIIDRLIRYRTLSYRKLEPVIDSDSTLVILFAPSIAPSNIIGIVVHTDRFIQSVVGKKLTDIAQNDFLLTVTKRSDGQTVFSTAPKSAGIFSHQRKLWIFPDHVVNIRLKGVTIEEAARGRFHRNIILIVILDIVLLAGAWFVYRLIRREMELVALKSDFVSNVSHELRTPLALIRMFTETLEMKRVKTEKKKREYYSIILHETERLTRLINNILNFSRMESKTRRYSFTPIKINDVIASVMTIYSYQLEKLNFTVETMLEENIPFIQADEEAIAEALHNLIDNAIKYSGEEKFIRITSQHTRQHVQISIHDHGIGIAPEHHAKIFEKFYRVSRGLVHTAKGSGLGLAIVQHIVQSHGGTISITSEHGKGSAFVITLPLTKER
ncbi:MAG: ATP-binding protein [Bacteriovoracaceae bacterium]|nr:HAMP domain-containing histidine kinase [Bacteroidota bacterium]